MTLGQSRVVHAVLLRSDHLPGPSLRRSAGIPFTFVTPRFTPPFLNKRSLLAFLHATPRDVIIHAVRESRRGSLTAVAPLSLFRSCLHPPYLSMYTLLLQCYPYMPSRILRLIFTVPPSPLSILPSSLSGAPHRLFVVHDFNPSPEIFTNNMPPRPPRFLNVQYDNVHVSALLYTSPPLSHRMC